MIVFALLWLFSVISAASLENWPLSERQQIAVRAQRDASNPIPLDQLTTLGVSLNQQIFERDGYTLASLNQVSELLDVNVQTLMVDLYWNEFIGKWQLCPAPFPKNITYDITSLVQVSWNSHTYTCEPALTPSDLMNTIQEYLSSTNVNMNVNLIQLLFNLKSIHYEYVKTNSTRNQDLTSVYTSTDSAYLALGNTTISDAFDVFGSNLFTPLNLAVYREGVLYTGPLGFYNLSSMLLPTLENFLLNQYNRIFTLVSSNELILSSKGYNFTKKDNNTLFFGEQRYGADPDNSNSQLEYDLQSIDNNTLAERCKTFIDTKKEQSLATFNDLALNSHFRFVIDNSGNSFDNSSFSNYIECGFSPILNASSYNTYSTNNSKSTDIGSIIDNFIPLSLWSWAVDQPLTPYSLENSLTIDYTLDESDQEEQLDLNLNLGLSQVAYKCVVITEAGWELANCYLLYPYACKSKSSPVQWIVDGDSHKQYFETYMDICPEGYTFSLPELSIEMLALRNHIVHSNTSYPVWIDMNDITVTNCFVTGGPYANCPYQKTITRLRLARLVAPSFIVAVLVLFLIFLEKFFRPKPVQTNRKRHWKRVINEYYKENEYEGVPS